VAEELIRQGFHVSLPLDETQFDLVATNGKKSFRIQVKSTAKPLKDYNKPKRYHFNITHGNSKKETYTLQDCDFLVCVALDNRRFWVIPIESITVSSLKIPPNKSSKYSKYEGRWDLMV